MKSLSIVLALLFVPGMVCATLDEYDFGAYRINGPPYYRYYDRTTRPGSQPVSTTAEDANEYWGQRYYGTEELSPRQSYELDRAILDLEAGNPARP